MLSVTSDVCPQSGGSSDFPDTLLSLEEDDDGRRVTCWLPESLYKLQGAGVAYVPIQQVVVAVPQGVTTNSEGRWSLQPVILSDHCFTSLRVMIPGHPLQGTMLRVPLYSREEEATLQMDFPTVIDYLRNFYETSIHLLEIVEDETSATTRFLVGSWQDPRMPHLPFYKPDVAGGPWFRDVSGNHKFLETIRSYQSHRRLPHDIEFFLILNSEQRSHLEELCSEVSTNYLQDAPRYRS